MSRTSVRGGISHELYLDANSWTHLGRPSRYLDEPPYYSAIIDHSIKPFKSKYSKIAKLYLKDGCSAAQIATKFGISKKAVLERLHRIGIRDVESKGARMTNPKNYRATFVPYGYRKVDGQLVINRKEMRICRLVVQLVDSKEYSLHGAARELMRRKIKNRKGNVWWDHSMVRGIFKRWQGRL